MNANELRELASTLEQCSPYRDSASVYQAADYLRACADALESGPVAMGWRSPTGEVADSISIEEAGRNGEGAYTIPLYPLAMPAQPVSVADELAADRIKDIAHRTAWRYRKSRDPHHSDSYTFNSATLIDFAAKLLFAMPAPAIPQGWKLVPVEPTPDMVEDGAFTIHDNGGKARWSDIREAWADMLTVAPTPPVATLRLPEPMTDAELRRLSIAADWRDIPLSAFARYIETETMRRVKEANK